MHFGHFSAKFEVCQDQVMGNRCHFLLFLELFVFLNISNTTTNMLLVVSCVGETVLRKTKTCSFSRFFDHFGICEISLKLLGGNLCNTKNTQNTRLGPFRTDPKMTTF